LISFEELLENKGNLSIIPTILFKKLVALPQFGKDSKLEEFEYNKKTGFDNFYEDKFYDDQSTTALSVYCKGDKNDHILYKDSSDDWNEIVYNKETKYITTNYSLRKTDVNNIISTSTKLYFIYDDKKRKKIRKERREIETIPDKNFKGEYNYSKHTTLPTYIFGDKIKKFLNDKRDELKKDIRGNQQIIVKELYKLLNDPEAKEDRSYSNGVLQKMKIINSIDVDRITSKSEYLRIMKRINDVFNK